jgi:hypothetical protein
MEPFRLLILTLDGDIVAKALAARFTRGLPEHWPTEFPIQSPPVGALQSLTRWMARELDRPGTALLHSPRTSASLERALLALFLECLQAHLPETEPAPGDMAACQLKRLEEWLDHNFAEPVGAEDMPELRVSAYAPYKMPFAASEGARRRRRSLAAGWTMLAACCATRLRERQ